MITKRNYAFDAVHPETGIALKVYQVDCFVERIDPQYNQPEFVFEVRFYETGEGQRVTVDPLVSGVIRKDACVVSTDVGNFFLKLVGKNNV